MSNKNLSIEEIKIKALVMINTNISYKKIAKKFNTHILIIKEWADAIVDEKRDASADERAKYNEDLTELKMLKAEFKTLKTTSSMKIKLLKLEIAQLKIKR